MAGLEERETKRDEGERKRMNTKGVDGEVGNGVGWLESQ